MSGTLRTLLGARAAAVVGRQAERAVLLDLAERDRPLVVAVHGIAGIGKSALLAAFASGQVDRSVVRMFRADRPGDATLVELTAWASLAAARRVGTWIPRGAAEADLDRGTTGTRHAGP